MAPLLSTTGRLFESLQDPTLKDLNRIVTAALNHAEKWLREASETGPEQVEAGARRFALTLGRAMELALLITQAQWSQVHEQDGRATAAARRFAQSAVDLIA